jgi:hypothetical protein
MCTGCREKIMARRPRQFGKQAAVLGEGSRTNDDDDDNRRRQTTTDDDETTTRRQQTTTRRQQTTTTDDNDEDRNGKKWLDHVPRNRAGECVSHNSTVSDPAHTSRAAAGWLGNSHHRMFFFAVPRLCFFCGRFENVLPFHFFQKSSWYKTKSYIYFPP